MKMPLLSKAIVTVAACAILPARASTFTVGGSGNTFTISRSGGEAANLEAINGVISVSAGDAPDALAPKAVSGITYSEGEATIFVPASAGRFVKAVIGVAAPAEGE